MSIIFSSFGNREIKPLSQQLAKFMAIWFYCLLLTPSFSQPPSITLEKYYKLQDSSYVGFTSCVEASSGDFIVAGRIFANRESDDLLMKISKTGDVVWTFRDTSKYHDWIYKLHKGANNEFLAIGAFVDTTKMGIYPLYLFFNENGEIINSFLVDTLGDRYSDAKADNDGFILLGIADSQLAAIKIKSNGTKQMIKQTAVPLDFSDQSYRFKYTNDGGYLLARIDTTSEEANLLRVVKLDPAGNAVWINKYSFKSLWGFAGDIIETRGGKIVIPLTCDSTRLLILGANGDVFAEHGQYSGLRNIRNAIATSDSNILLMGSSTFFSDPKPQDFYVFKIDTKGEIIWSFFDNDRPQDGSQIIELSNGELLIAGETCYYSQNYYDGWLLKISAGNLVYWKKQGLKSITLPYDKRYFETAHFNLLGRKLDNIKSPERHLESNQPVVCKNKNGTSTKDIAVK